VNVPQRRAEENQKDPPVRYRKIVPTRPYNPHVQPPPSLFFAYILLPQGHTASSLRPSLCSLRVLPPLPPRRQHVRATAGRIIREGIRKTQHPPPRSHIVRSPLANVPPSSRTLYIPAFANHDFPCPCSMRLDARTNAPVRFLLSVARSLVHRSIDESVPVSFMPAGHPVSPHALPSLGRLTPTPVWVTSPRHGVRVTRLRVR